MFHPPPRRIFAPLVTLTVFSTLAVFFGLTFLSLGAVQTAERTIKITAHKFEYEPNQIQLKLGEPVVLELTSKDVTHGFNISELGLRADLEPGETVSVRLVPEKTGTFEFHCDNFCGIDHESMSGTITVQ
jgi:cytochrome c oxidase subunit II